MKISIITVFPEVHETFLKLSIIGRAIEKGLVSFNLVRMADFCQPKERIDEPTVGPGTGMIIKPEVIERAITHCEQQWGQGHKIFFSPQGVKLTQPVFRQLAKEFFRQQSQQSIETNIEPERSTKHIILICPRYEGIDERVEAHYADMVVSIGDYVLMGGDVPAHVFLEGLLRLMPGIVGKWESVEHESFTGSFLDYPEYGLPVEWMGMKIPDIVQSGNHAAIDEWRTQQACEKTKLKRFDWFATSNPDKKSMQRMAACIPPHYVALMHTQIKLKDGSIGNTSITSIDLHDTARSCATYGVKNFFMVSPLADQQAIIATLLDFWHSDIGKQYNSSRFHAVNKVKPMYTFDDVIVDITQQEGKVPVIVATSAKEHAHIQKIDYTQQGVVWQHNRPVLFLFGTGQGLADSLVDRCDFLLAPIRGLTEFNHLSVRSAMAVILDRWLGLKP